MDRGRSQRLSVATLLWRSCQSRPVRTGTCWRRTRNRLWAEVVWMFDLLIHGGSFQPKLDFLTRGPSLNSLIVRQFNGVSLKENIKKDAASLFLTHLCSASLQQGELLTAQASGRSQLLAFLHPLMFPQIHFESPPSLQAATREEFSHIYIFGILNLKVSAPSLSISS